jgi:hypothetical protein
MKERQEPLSLPRPIAAALSELQAGITQHFPTASFPGQTYLITTVDIEDPDEVMDSILDRLLELQLDEGLPINVVPIHTPE